MIKIMQLQGGIAMIGDVEKNMAAMHPEYAVKSPRVIQLRQMGPQQPPDIVFAVLFGEPEEIAVEWDKVLFSYEPKTEGFIAAYREAVTGLTLAKVLPPNALQFPAGKGGK